MFSKRSDPEQRQEISEMEIRALLARVLTSQSFRQAPGMSRFLAFVVGETIEGRSAGLKEYPIGVEVCDRGDNFDPRIDTIVRVQARRVRAKLIEYYEREGKEEDVWIELPKGAYVPVFTRRTPSPVALRDSIPLPMGTGLKTRFRLAWAAAALTILVGGSLFVQSLRSARGANRIYRSIAVLPLKNLSSDPSQDYFADGLTEALITDVAQLQAVRVIAWPSVLAYRDTKKTPGQVGEELHVDSLLEGGVVHEDGQVRVTVRLVDAASGATVWAQSYNREFRRILNLQAELSNAVLTHVRSALSPLPQVSVDALPDVDPEAHRLYMLGRYKMNQLTESSLNDSVKDFLQAIERQPRHADAYASLAEAYLLLSNNYVAPRESMPKARAAALKAIEIDPSVAEGHAVLGTVHLFYDWDAEAAGSELKAALRLNPSSALAQDSFTNYYVALGRYDEALAANRRGLEFNPISTILHFDGQWANLAARRFGESAKLGRQVLEIAPKFALARSTLGLSLAMQGRFPEAINELREAVHTSDAPTVGLLLAHGYALAGEREKARKILEETKSIAKRKYVCAYEVASVHAILGEKAQALSWFEKAIHDRCDCDLWYQAEPWLDAIRQDPIFAELGKRLRVLSPEHRN